MLYLVCAALLALAIGLSLLPEASAPRTPSTSIEDVATLRAATHEAGHAVAAWFCTGVAEIKYVKINGVGGEVRYSMFEDKSIHYHWFDAVASLAGLVAELHLIGKTTSLGAGDDLAQFRASASKLIELGCASPAWHSEPHASPFWKAFSEPMSEAELSILNIAHGKALQLAKLGATARIRDLLLERKSLSQADLEATLGSRCIIRAMRILPMTFIEIGANRV